MTAVVFATLPEAEPFLDRVNARRIAEFPRPVYRFALSGDVEDGLVILSGVGLANARTAVEWAVREHDIDFIVNAGICGIVRAGPAVGEVFRVDEVFDGDALLRGETVSGQPCSVDRNPWQNLNGARLASVTDPVFESARKTVLGTTVDLVEMEGLGVVRACVSAGLPVALLKGVTDTADEHGKGYADIQNDYRGFYCSMPGGRELYSCSQAPPDIIMD